MSSITTINSGDLISTSRTTINTNFSNLNTDKIETSVIDTDTTLAANSDSKIASQKATKAYTDSVVGANATTTSKGVLEVATAAEINAGTATGATGAALAVTPDQLKLTNNPVVRTYLNAGSPATWSKPAGLKYVVVEVQAGGGNGAAGADLCSSGRGGGGGGGGGYSKKLIAAATLSATETVTTGAATASSSFGTHATATAGGNASSAVAGAGGIGSSGDINLEGGDGNDGTLADSAGGGANCGGIGGSSCLGGGGAGSGATATAGSGGNVYGGGGGGGAGSGAGSSSGGNGAAGIVIVTEFYS